MSANREWITRESERTGMIKGMVYPVCDASGNSESSHCKKITLVIEKDVSHVPYS